MKRAILQLLFCVILGAFLTIGIAWWCIGAASWPITRINEGSDSNDVEPFMWLWPERAIGVAEPQAQWESNAFGAISIWQARHKPTIGPPTGSTGTFLLTQRTARAGWPMLALQTRDQYPSRHEWRPRSFTERLWINSFEQGLYFSDSAELRQIVFPLVPRWPGFAVNTLVYAGLVWAMGASLVTVRRVVRRRRGRCSRCGYELHDLTTCPECGDKGRS